MMPGPENRITVGEIWHLAMPSGTTLAGGRDGLPKPVEWVASLRAVFPLFGALDRGYLALARLGLVRRLDSRLTPAYLIAELHRAQACAMVVDEPISSADAALADRLAMPVFILPSGADPHEVEREILRTLINREGQLARREMEARQHLQQLFGRGGMQAVLSELAQLTTGEVVIADKGNASVAQSGGVLGHLGHETSFPIRIGGKTLGQLVLRTAAAEVNPLHAIYARQAAEICGIEMLQRLTRQETEERLGLDLVEQLLDEGQEGESIVARFRRLGHDLSPQRRHVAVALGSAAEANQYAACSDTARDLQWLSQREGASVISANYHRHFLVFASFSENISERTIRTWLQEVLGSAAAQHCSAGASRAVLIAEPPSPAGIRAMREIVHQALDAWDLGQRIAGRASPFYYEELGLYRLLANLRSQEEMQRFYQETLGALADYDAAHNAELVRTLEVFFRENANASQTARALYVHRNTLNYRLQRIVEITGLDLDDAEARLALQVAIKIHHLTH